MTTEIGHDYTQLCEELGREFVTNPMNFITEVDLQVRFVEKLRSELECNVSDVKNPILKDTSRSYKQDYWKEIQSRLVDNQCLDRVHTELSVQQGERLDVAVFEPQIGNQIQWVASGSKRFKADDLECVAELKYIKNKYKFPTETGTTVAQLKSEDLSVEDLLKSNTLDVDENNLVSDIRELNRLNEVDARYYLIFSNNNYLYKEPTHRELDHRNGPIYEKLGRAARQWMDEAVDSEVGILYTHPLGTEWISPPE